MHDARIGDYETLARSVNIAGCVTIGDAQQSSLLMSYCVG
jgi:acyl-[acyl carrier protein]--UDP-N-acetylglucosamine O-acyltransferase